MITGYRSLPLSEPERGRQIQWGAAVGAGLVAGFILLVVPRGSPWSSLTFFSPVIMGRAMPAGLGLPLGLIYLIHIAVSIIYGLLISRVVASLRQERAILTGGLAGLVLYVINFGVFSAVAPAWRGAEVTVVFTHIVFGLICAGAYRGLLRRRVRGASGEQANQPADPS
jgi:hypothetical protein